MSASAYRQPAPKPNLVELGALVGRCLPRCSACGGDLQVIPPDLLPGRVVCGLCSREYAEVVDRVRVIRPLTEEEKRPRRGRPPTRLDHSRCESEPCNACKVTVWPSPGAG